MNLVISAFLFKGSLKVLMVCFTFSYAHSLFLLQELLTFFFSPSFKKIFIDSSKRWKDVINVLWLFRFFVASFSPTFQNRSHRIRHLPKRQFWSLEFPSFLVYKGYISLGICLLGGFHFMLAHTVKSLADHVGKDRSVAVFGTKRTWWWRWRHWRSPETGWICKYSSAMLGVA